MTPQRVVITGGSGYLGGRLTEHLRTLGCQVRTTSRTATDPRLRLRLGELVPDGCFADTDTVIHAAHEFAPGSLSLNVEGSRAVVNAARTAGARRLVYLSSYSAGPDAGSEYGETKHQVEQVFRKAGGVIARPGLVIGNGGLFARQRKTLLRWPLVPVIGDGSMPTSFVAIQHFVSAMAVIVDGAAEGSEFGLFYEAHPPVRDFIRSVKQEAGQTARLLPIPAGLAIAALQAGAALGIPLPATPGQVQALLRNTAAPWRSSLADLLPAHEQEFTLLWALRALASGR